VTLGVLANHCRAAAENMAYTLYRTAHSTFVKGEGDVAGPVAALDEVDRPAVADAGIPRRAEVLGQVTLGVLANHCRAAAENMAYTLYRTAHSTFVKETAAKPPGMQIVVSSWTTTAGPARVWPCRSAARQ
jgi:N-methylhydantoinase B/oxoprolinase/acetone carboxylase alpha subunit